MKALIFPGQGSQALGMGMGLFERFPSITRCADEILGLSAKELCLRDPDARLASTQFAQPAIFVVNALHLQALRETAEGDAAFVAGHSLGEYSALFAADVFSFEDGLRIVKKRGELFARVNGGGMAAVVGLSARRIREILYEAGISEVGIANLNSGEQTVVSGNKTALDSCKLLFQQAGCVLFHALNVSGAFHSQYMTPAKEEFEAFLGAFKFGPPAVQVVSNVTARPYGSEGIVDYLVEQIDHPVRWSESVRYMLRNGVTEFQEVGHGQVLTRLCDSIRLEPSAATAPKTENSPQLEDV